jgi:hypothetical protein
MPQRLPPSQSLDPYSYGITSGLDNILNAFMMVPTPQSINPLSGREVSTWNGDEAYENQSFNIGQTVLDLMFTANQTWYTEKILPWKSTDNIHVTWELWEAKAHAMEANAHQAPARLIKQSRYSHVGHLIRYGISFQVEHDWAKTPIGRQSIMIGYAQMARAYQETANLEVIKALLHASDWNKQWNTQSGKVTRLDHIEYLRRERDFFAYFQKEKNAPTLWDSRTDAESHRYGGRFDTIIVPEMMYNYVTLVRPESTDYYLRGKKGPAAIDGNGGAQIPAPLLADRKEPRHWMNGKRVYQARAYSTSDVEPVELLAKRIQIGEYNEMRDQYCIYDNNYKSCHRDIMIYDEDRDRYSKISLKTALANCGLFTSDGKLNPPPPNNDGAYASSSLDAQKFFLLKEDGNMVEKIGDINPLFLTPQMLHHIKTTSRGKQLFDNAPIKASIDQINSEVGTISKLSFIQDEITESFVDTLATVLPKTENRKKISEICQNCNNIKDALNDIERYLKKTTIGQGLQFSSEKYFDNWFEPRKRQFLNDDF